MKLVLDTSVFISAFYFGGNLEKIINRIIEGRDKLYIHKNTLDEIAKVMVNIDIFTDEYIIDRYIGIIEKLGKKVILDAEVTGHDDPFATDDFGVPIVKEIILASNADDVDYFITEDTEHLEEKDIRAISFENYLDRINYTAN
jgi:predicted nucleic acid-binding protein